MFEENITPDVVEEAPVDETVEQVEADDSPVESEATEQSDAQEESVQEVIDKLKITYNGEEKELSFDEAKVLAQKGMNYDKVLSKLDEAKNDKLLKWAETFRDKNGFNDTDTFLTALAKEEDDRKLNELISKNIPKEYAEKLLEVDKIKEQLAKKDEQEKDTKEFSDFLDWHDNKVKGGIFSEPIDVKAIPQTVWDRTKDGMSLREAYMEYSFENMKSATEQETIAKLNKNAQTTPGSVNKNSKSDETPMSQETIEKTLAQMTPDQQKDWVKKNYDKVEKAGFFD